MRFDSSLLTERDAARTKRIGDPARKLRGNMYWLFFNMSNVMYILIVIPSSILLEHTRCARRFMLS
jgi:hypothetical protein